MSVRIYDDGKEPVVDLYKRLEEIEERIHMSDLPLTDKMPRRPVYDRYLRRKHHMPLDPPTDAEKRDAIRILGEPYLWEDHIWVEAQKILDEASE